MKMTPAPGPYRLVYRSFDDIVWHSAKSDEILSERGFDLGFVSRLFPGWVLERQDTRSYRETRYQAFGELLGIVYFIVYTRSGPTCRLITAWEADIDEERLWYDAFR